MTIGRSGSGDGLRVELIVNSIDAGDLDRIRQGIEAQREVGHRVTVSVTFEAGDAERFARDAAVRGADLVIAAGGDGTLNEVVNGLIAAPRSGGPEATPALGIVPIGTANDFANFVGVPGEIEDAIAAAVEVVESGGESIVDVGALNGRYFLNASSGGLGPEATEEAGERTKRLLGGLAYLVRGVRTFATLESSTARFAAAGEVIHDGEFLLFVVGNGDRAGGGNRLTPRADLRDGLLDFCLVRDLSHAEFIRLIPQLRGGEHLESEHVVYRQLAELRIDSTDGVLAVNIDGESADARVLEYRTIPGALRLALRLEMPG